MHSNNYQPILPRESIVVISIFNFRFLQVYASNTSWGERSRVTFGIFAL